jgi:PKD repeat protein
MINLIKRTLEIDVREVKLKTIRRLFGTIVLCCFLVFCFFPITVAIPIKYVTNLENKDISMDSDATFAQGNITIIRSDSVEASIIQRELKLSEHFFKTDDINSNKSSPFGFIVKPNKIQSLSDNKNCTISEGSYIIHGSDGITRVFSDDGTQVSFSIDSEAEKIFTPSGSVIPSTHSISVPSGSLVEHFGNNIHISLNNSILLSISNNDQNTDLDSVSQLKSSINNNPAIEPGGWIEWVKNTSPYYVAETDATWTIPYSPPLNSHQYQKGGFNYFPVNFIFNGIQGPDGTSILQPVAGYDNRAFNADGVSWQDNWYGSAYICGPGTQPGDCIHSTPIPLQVGDGVMGEINYDPSENWTVYLFNDGATTQKNSLLFYRDHNYAINPNNVDLFLAYEAYLCYNNQTACTPDANTLTTDEVRFYSINLNAKINGVLTPVTPIWSADSKPDTWDHPLLTGIYPDLSQVPDRVNLETHRTSFTITPSAPGTGGYIYPATPQTVSWGDNSPPFTIRAYQHNIIDNVYIIYPNGDAESIGPKSTYTFQNVQSDYEIRAIFKESEFTPVSNFINSISGNEVSFTDTSSNSPQDWIWNFGDPLSGDLNTATIQNPTHNYVYGGNYIITMTSSNANGAGTTNIQNISITGPPPPSLAADFTTSPTYNDTPLTVTFTDESDGSPTGWAWYFGDETFTQAWTNVTASAEWQDRYGHTMVAMPDGSVVLMGGKDGTTSLRDVWRSINNGTTWEPVTTTADWPKRVKHTSVVMPDGGIVLMGGRNGNTYMNDVWQSINNGSTWSQVNAAAGWTGRYGHTSVAMPDGSIILMGGNNGNGVLNDVWRSTDNGETWTEINSSAGWSARYGHTSVVLPDKSIVLMGGNTGSGARNDVWRSTNNGTTWTVVNASAEWQGRYEHTSVALPDGTIFLMGGNSGSGLLNDIWRSKDNGATWKRVTASAGWSARSLHSSVVLPNGRIVLTGGDDGSTLLNDVWRFSSAKSLEQNTSHTYTIPGTYTVTLQASGLTAFNSTTKARLIHAGMKDYVGVFRNTTHLFFLDYNRNESWEDTTIDRRYDYFGVSGDIPLAGDWDGDGVTEIGSSNDYPIAGDWDGNGKTEIGVFRKSTDNFILDSNGNGILDNSSTDRRINFSSVENDIIPVTGDWNDDGKTEIGIFRNSNLTWYLDMNNNGSRETGEGPFTFGSAGDIPVTGDWNGNGVTDIGIFQTTGLCVFHLDYDEDKSWVPANDKSYNLVTGNYPISGRW